MASERPPGSPGGTPEEPTPEPRDLVATPEGVRPQRSTEEHGSGLDRPAPEAPDRAARSGQGAVGPSSAGPGTPEGHAPEKPTADEYGKRGTPAAGLTRAEPHAADRDDTHGGDVEAREDLHAMDAHHVGGGHDEGHATGHDHADEHAEEPLGPVDWRAWGASALGLGVAALIAALFYVATLPK